MLLLVVVLVVVLVLLLALALVLLVLPVLPVLPALPVLTRGGDQCSAVRRRSSSRAASASTSTEPIGGSLCGFFMWIPYVVAAANPEALPFYRYQPALDVLQQLPGVQRNTTVRGKAYIVCTRMYALDCLR